jgi:hypothetical protein
VDAHGSDKRPVRLGIIHFLGWTLGCALVLAILRASGEQEEIPAKFVFRARMYQLGFGLAYGTAFSGLGLFLWRWRTGQGPGPTQPGHWLILFGGIAVIVDLGTAGAVKCVLVWLGYKANDWRFNLWDRSIGFSIGLILILTVLALLRDASRLWTIFVVFLAAVLATNAIVNIVSLYSLAHGARGGQWVWYIPEYAIVLLSVVGLPLLWLAEIADRIRGLPRDWLHGGGIAAITALGLVSFAARLPLVWQ